MFLSCRLYVQNILQNLMMYNKIMNPNFSSDACRYFQPSLTKSLKANNQDLKAIEMSSMVGPTNDLDHTPFKSLRPCSQMGLCGGRVSPSKMQGPVVCSVAPNLPARPPSCSDNDSIRKNHWDMDYEGELGLLGPQGDGQDK